MKFILLTFVAFASAFNPSLLWNTPHQLKELPPPDSFTDCHNCTLYGYFWRREEQQCTIIGMIDTLANRAASCKDYLNVCQIKNFKDNDTRPWHYEYSFAPLPNVTIPKGYFCTHEVIHELEGPGPEKTNDLIEHKMTFHFTNDEKKNEVVGIGKYIERHFINNVERHEVIEKYIENYGYVPLLSSVRNQTVIWVNMVARPAVIASEFKIVLDELDSLVPYLWHTLKFLALGVAGVVVFTLVYDNLAARVTKFIIYMLGGSEKKKRE